MKRLTCAGLLVALAGTLFVACQRDEEEIKYNANGKLHLIPGAVMYVDRDSVQFETQDGNGWVIDPRPGYKVGQAVYILYDDMGTKSIYDDSLVCIITE